MDHIKRVHASTAAVDSGRRETSFGNKWQTSLPGMCQQVGAGRGGMNLRIYCTCQLLLLLFTVSRFMFTSRRHGYRFVPRYFSGSLITYRVQAVRGILRVSYSRYTRLVHPPGIHERGLGTRYLRMPSSDLSVAAAPCAGCHGDSFSPSPHWRSFGSACWGACAPSATTSRLQPGRPR